MLGNVFLEHFLHQTRHIDFGLKAIIVLKYGIKPLISQSVNYLQSITPTMEHSETR